MAELIRLDARPPSEGRLLWVSGLSDDTTHAAAHLFSPAGLLASLVVNREGGARGLGAAPLLHGGGGGALHRRRDGSSSTAAA